MVYIHTLICTPFVTDRLGRQNCGITGHSLWTLPTLNDTLFVTIYFSSESWDFVTGGSCPPLDKLKYFPLTFDFPCLVLKFSKTLDACIRNT